MKGIRKYDRTMAKLDKKIKKLRRRVERYRPDLDSEYEEQDNRRSHRGSPGRESRQSSHSHPIDVISLHDQSSDSDVLSIHSYHSMLEQNWENIIDNQIQTEVPDKIQKNEGKQDVRKTKINNMHKKWNAILLNGLTAEVRDWVMEKYDVPKSCQLLTPPKLNEEVAAIIKASGLKRDEKIREKQAILSAAISAIGHAIENMPNKDNSMAIENLNEAAQLLCDAFHSDSTSRRTLIIAGVNKDLKNLIEKTVISKYLFGDNLQSKMNACEAINNKSAEELKCTPWKLYLPAVNKSSNFQDCQQLPKLHRSELKLSTKRKPPSNQLDNKIKLRGRQQPPISPRGPKHTPKPKPPAKQSSFRGSLQPPIIFSSGPKYPPKLRPPVKSTSVVNNNLNFWSPLQPPIIRQSGPKPIAKFRTYNLMPSPAAKPDRLRD